MLSSSDLAKIERLIPDLAAVYLFGSRARKHARADSDVDIALAAGRAITARTLTKVRETLELSLGQDVDVVDLSRAPLTLTHQVLAEGYRIHAPRPVVANLLEVRLMRDYEDLKRRRAGIESDIIARGRVFAP